ncbi:MAG: hypothetical protein AAGG01_23760, partial [Planctomycetota bacterium]
RRVSSTAFERRTGIYLPLEFDPNGDMGHVAVDADGGTIAYGGFSGVVVCDRHTGELQTVLKSAGGEADCRDLAFSRDSASISAVFSDGELCCWDLATAEIRRSAKLGDLVRSGAVCFGASEELLVGTTDGAVMLFHLDRADSEPELVMQLTAEVMDIDSLDGRVFFASSAFGEIARFELENGGRSARWRVSEQAVHCLALNEGRNEVAYSAGAGLGAQAITISSLSNPLEVNARLEGHTRTIADIEWVPGVPDRLLSTSYDGSHRVWDPDLGVELLSLDAGWGWEIAVLPDGSGFAASEWGLRTLVYSRSTVQEAASPELRESVALHRRARELFERELSVAGRLPVVRELIRNSGESEEVRRAALSYSRWLEEDPGIVRLQALACAVDAAAPDEEIVAALARVSVATERHGGRLGAAALYLRCRAGDYEAVRDELLGLVRLRLRGTEIGSNQKAETNMESRFTSDVFDMVFLALAQARLGEYVAARASLDEAQSLRSFVRASLSAAELEWLDQLMTEVRAEAE